MTDGVETVGLETLHFNDFSSRRKGISFSFNRIPACSFHLSRTNGTRPRADRWAGVGRSGHGVDASYRLGCSLEKSELVDYRWLVLLLFSRQGPYRVSDGVGIGFKHDGSCGERSGIS